MKSVGEEEREKLQWVLTRCKEQGMRKTQGLVRTLQLLLRADRPLTINELVQDEVSDTATVYRLIHRLMERGLVQQLGMGQRASYFKLVLPGEHHDYLICQSCGTIESIDVPCLVHKMEASLSETTGYIDLKHELEFFGTCPKCATLER